MFEVFDRDGNGQISMEEVLKTLRQMVGSNINDDQLAQVCIFRLVFLSSCSDCQTSCLRERQRWISLLNKRNAFCWNGRFPQNNGPQNSRIQNERQILNDEENNSFKFTFLPKFLIKKQLYSFIFTKNKRQFMLQAPVPEGCERSDVNAVCLKVVLFIWLLNKNKISRLPEYFSSHFHKFNLRSFIFFNLHWIRKDRRHFAWLVFYLAGGFLLLQIPFKLINVKKRIENGLIKFMFF